MELSEPSQLAINMLGTVMQQENDAKAGLDKFLADRDQILDDLKASEQKLRAAKAKIQNWIKGASNPSGFLDP